MITLPNLLCKNCGHRYVAHNTLNGNYTGGPCDHENCPCMQFVPHDDAKTVMDNKTLTFEQELSALINKHSIENESNTPDFILAEYLKDCLAAFDKATNRRSMWNRKND